ncbi:MAG: lysostaphin resistance A-like protein [Nitrospiraceae bacterium]
MPPELDRAPLQTQAAERSAAWALLPVAATVGYHLLPASSQEQAFIQFTPQVLAYLTLSCWAARNTAVLPRLGLEKDKVTAGLRLGLLTGLLLGGLNTLVILSAYPSLGYDILFLKTTPHGQLPPMLMVPWVIVGIALFVELNFRGFLLGRLASIEAGWWNSAVIGRCSPLALLTSALTFAFDPFMVNTFRHLHWIAVWDGLIWGAIWVRTRNLYATIVAHAVEVSVMYLAVKATIG